MPDNVRIFTSEQIENVYLEELDVRVYGHAYNTPHPEIRPLAGFTKDLGNSKKILVTHSVITDGFSPYSAISEADIERSGFDYIALGHIHSHDGCTASAKRITATAAVSRGVTSASADTRELYSERSRRTE